MKINSKELQKALDAVKPGIATKEVIEQTSSFVFMDNKIISYNDEICIMSPFEIGGLSGAIKAEEMYNFMKKVKTEEVDFTIEENEVVIKSGRAKVGFAVVTEILLPIEEEIGQIKKWGALPEKFVDSINMAANTASDDMGNPKLTCVHLVKDGFAEATDNYRVIKCAIGETLPIKKSTLIPATSLKEVVKLKPTKIAEGNGWTHFKNEKGVTISCRVFNESFVEIDHILGLGGEGTKFTFPENSVDILDKVNAFTKTQMKDFKMEQVEVSFNGKLLKFEITTNTSWFKETVPVKGKKEFHFLITPYLLQDILKVSRECAIHQNILKFETADFIYVTSLFVKE